jgi:RNA polymerase sigma-70 factor (ECF subfamily)
VSPPPNLSGASDQELVAWACQGREDAYGELLRRHHRPVYALIHRLVRDHDLAEDLTQDTFVKAFGALERHRPESKFSSWILKIANNRAVDHLKREGRLKRRRLDTVPLEPTPDASSPRKRATGRLLAAASNTPTPTPLDTRALAPALEQALGRLKQRHRLCFILREIEGRSYEDIAEILDLPVGTVGSCLSRARKQLRATLGPAFTNRVTS